tara:strand:- start:26267 stop:28522 length:2256 start_codon:yes stop_codon:yes gene_type:complete
VKLHWESPVVQLYEGDARHLDAIPDDYPAFLERKRVLVPQAGAEVGLGQISDVLYPFQRQLVQWALRKGRSAVWADCGLGKTFIQLEWARLTGGEVLIVAPLAVAGQTIREAAALGLEVGYARDQAEVSGRISITNYERVKAFDPSRFGAVVLDESSILKSIDGKTRSTLIEMFADVPYKLCCTATPAPNDIAEFANHAAFLGVCTREEMLSMFFVHDDDGWRLKGHARQGFYQWMASWGMMLKRPSDIGFSDDGYILPELTVSPSWVDADATAIAQASGQLFPTGLGGVAGRSAARRETLDAKVSRAAAILNASEEPWIVWVGLNDEGRQLGGAIPDAVVVEGRDSLEAKTEMLSGFVEGRIRVLVTKVSIAGFGLNLQHCKNVMFVGLNDSYESWYQAIRRCWRFGQVKPVNVVVVLSDLERPILENVLAKETTAEDAAAQLVGNLAVYERAELTGKTPVNGYHENDAVGDNWWLLLGDCVERMAELESGSADLAIFSPPFLSLYVYSDSDRDLGNSRTEAEFFTHFGYMIRELARVVKPGRNIACHVSQVPTKLVTDGVIGLKDFRGEAIRAFQREGLVYHGEVVIDKDPQAQAIRTHSKGLLFKQLRKDSSWLRPGLADFILVFRVPGDNAVPIQPEISNDQWIEWARPIWYGIRESDTLHVAEGRAEQDERHIAPLQLGTIKRCIALWSNPGEVVFSPFAGIGSEGYQAILDGRRFVGIELKDSYYQAAVRNLGRAEERVSQGRLL